MDDTSCRNSNCINCKITLCYQFCRIKNIELINILFWFNGNISQKRDSFGSLNEICDFPEEVLDNFFLKKEDDIVQEAPELIASVGLEKNIVVRNGKIV